MENKVNETTNLSSKVLEGKLKCHLTVYQQNIRRPNKNLRWINLQLFVSIAHDVNYGINICLSVNNTATENNSEDNFFIWTPSLTNMQQISNEQQMKKQT